MTAVRCDCCGQRLVDEVGALVIEDAIIAYRDELRAKARREREAWQDAEAQTQAALREAGAL